MPDLRPPKLDDATLTAKLAKRKIVLLERRPVDGAADANDGVTVVLCFQPADPARYVTWRVGPIGDTYWGHYFDDLGEAWIDYKTRI